MDDQRFDQLARALGSGWTRRGAVRSALGGLAAAAGGLALLSDAGARKKGKAKRQKGKGKQRKKSRGTLQAAANNCPTGKKNAVCHCPNGQGGLQCKINCVGEGSGHVNDTYDCMCSGSICHPSGQCVPQCDPSQCPTDLSHDAGCCVNCPTGQSCVNGSCQTPPQTCTGTPCTQQSDCDKFSNCECPLATAGVTTEPVYCRNASCVPQTCANFPNTCKSHPDGCGGMTPVCTCPNQYDTCSADGQCVACVPKTCAAYPGKCGRQSDGCGGQTDECKCPKGKCENGTCSDVCKPSCHNKKCGESDGCGGICGWCPEKQLCVVPKDGGTATCKPIPHCSPNGGTGACCSGHHKDGVCCDPSEPGATSIIVDVNVYNQITVAPGPVTVIVTVTTPAPTTPTTVAGGGGKRKRRRRRRRRGGRRRKR